MSESEKVEAVEKKEKKEKKVMTPERLEQLARARKKALEIRQAGVLVHRVLNCYILYNYKNKD